VNPRGTPQWVRAHHLANQGADLLINRWTAIQSLFRAPPRSAAKPIAMPPDDGVRLRDNQCFAPVSPASREGDAKEAVARPEPDLSRRAVEGRRLLPQGKALQHQFGMSLSASVKARTITMSSSTMR
jgi:hypothetical protein